MGLLPRFRARPVWRGNPNALSDGALTAAGFRVTHADSENLRRLIQPWQSRAFSYYDQLGEIKYASQFYARMLSPLRLYAAELDDKDDWVESENEIAKDALARIQDPGGGRETLLGSYGRLLFIAGEGLLFCSLDKETGLEQWEFLSTDELRVQGNTYIRYKAPSLQAEEYHEPRDEDWVPVDDDTAIAYRLWRRHPRFSALADSTMMGVLDECEELLLLTRAVRARARSRLAGAGILAISEDFSYAPLEATPDEDIRQDPFLADLTAAMMAPIANEGAASAVVPLVIRGTTEAVEKGIRHIQIVDPMQLYPETGLRNELIDRIAIGLDMPPEILRGLGDANHWSSWQIDEQAWKAHGQPIANQLVNDLTAAYFRPQLRADGVTDWTRFKIAYDPADVINHPDRTKDAKDAYKDRVIGKKWYREQIGAPEDAAPTKAELAEMIGVATRDSSLAWFGTPAPRGSAVEVAPGEISPNNGSDVPQEGPTTGAEVEPGPPDEPPDPQALLASFDLATVSRIVGAADLALLRAREAAGHRLRSLAKRDPDAAKMIEGLPGREIAPKLGRDRVKALGVTEIELVAPAAALIKDSLRVWGIDAQASSLIAEQIERHAAKTLYEERPATLPPQFHNYVAGILRDGRPG